MGLEFPAGRLIGVGEAMVEMAPVAGGLYAQAFAGDTFNTVWYLARLCANARGVGYLTRIGEDALSDRFVARLTESGVATDAVQRDSQRTLGLYLITLNGAERSFTYWRGESAARRLADNPAKLAASLTGAALIHVSGITLAILDAAGRETLMAALDQARERGARVSYDPNLRRRLWADETETRQTMEAMFRRCDIALPSFDDEASLWGDASPQASATRIAALGVREIVVKNGPGEACVAVSGAIEHVPARIADDARDTTGAGDSFNAGYLAARLAGSAPPDACRFAHRLAGEVVRHPGALAPIDAIEPLAEDLRRQG